MKVLNLETELKYFVTMLTQLFRSYKCSYQVLQEKKEKGKTMKSTRCDQTKEPLLFNQKQFISYSDIIIVILTSHWYGLQALDMLIQHLLISIGINGPHIQTRFALSEQDLWSSTPSATGIQLSTSINIRIMFTDHLIADLCSGLFCHTENFWSLKKIYISTLHLEVLCQWSPAAFSLYSPTLTKIKVKHSLKPVACHYS